MKVNNSEKVIVKRINGENQQNAITELAHYLVERGFVKKSFIDAVLEREKIYPTGLPTSSIGVAIPHTDAIHVNKTTIAVGILDNPVKFTMMGNDSIVDVKMIFMLAIKEPKGQLSVLQNLMAFFQDEQGVAAINNCDNEEMIKEIIETTIFKLETI